MVTARRGGAVRISNLLPRMLIFVAVKTQKLPVAAVGGIIVVVVIFVMNRELTKFRAAEFTSAMPAHPGVHLERLLSIPLCSLALVTPCLTDNPLLPVPFRLCFLRCHLLVFSPTGSRNALRT